MTCCHSKDCNCHQNTSFIFGLIAGLVIAAIIAVIIYKNNRRDVFVKLKKQLEKFFSNLKPKSEKLIESLIIPDLPKKNNVKKEVTIPKNLIITDNTAKTITKKPSKMFKK